MITLLVSPRSLTHHVRKAASWGDTNLGFAVRVPSSSLGSGIYEHVTLILYAMLSFLKKFSVWLFYLDEKYVMLRDFPGGPVVKNLPADAGDMGSSPGPGRSHMPQSN